MNSDEIWLLQLWSGAFGAILGAGGAAAVAMLVLRRTNAHQAVLAAQAMALQRELAGVALQEQREQAALQQARTERAHREQLDHQTVEASKARFFAAIADFIAGVELCSSRSRNGELSDDVMVNLETAVTRMGLDSDSEPFIDELYEWPTIVVNLADAASDHSMPSADELREALNEATAAVANAVTEWPKAGPERQAELLSRMEEKRQSSELVIDAFLLDRSKMGAERSSKG